MPLTSNSVGSFGSRPAAGQADRSATSSAGRNRRFMPVLGWLFLQVPGEEVEHRLVGLLGVGPLEPVAGPFEQQQLGLDPGGLQLLDQPLALLVVDVGV